MNLSTQLSRFEDALLEVDSVDVISIAVLKPERHRERQMANLVSEITTHWRTKSTSCCFGGILVEKIR